MSSNTLPFGLTPIDRERGARAGLIGGLVGLIVMRWFVVRYADSLVRDVPDVPLGDAVPEAARLISVVPPFTAPQYQPGETTSDALGRIVYTSLVGGMPQGETRRLTADLAEIAWAASLGIAYGATRHTRRWRDLAGSLFFGLRIFAGGTLAPHQFGLAPHPAGVSLRQHARSLVAHLVFSFVTVNVTRVLYRLLR